MYKAGSYILRVDTDNVSLMRGEVIVCKGIGDTLTYLLNPPEHVSDDEADLLEEMFSRAVLRDGYLLVKDVE